MDILRVTEAIRMACDLPWWASLPIFMIAYSVAVYAVSAAIGKLVSVIKSFKRK